MTQQEILSRLLSEVSDEFDKSAGSFFYDAQKPVAMELEGIYADMESILKNGFVIESFLIFSVKSRNCSGV